jgi:hypothetical protein
MRDEHKYILGKVDFNGTGRKINECAITWTMENGRFSMCAEVWNGSHTDCITCGQCVDGVAALFPHDKKAQRMLAIWQRWHLNDMHAGTPAQEKYLRDNPVEEMYRSDHYTHACLKLQAALLDPDPETGYRYGHAWLTEDLPQDVINEINSWSA